MADFVLYGETDDNYTDADGEFWYPGTGISTYNGGAGQDTLDFSASTDNLLWYEPIGFSWVQDPSIPLGQPGDDGFVAEYAYGVLQGWEHVIAGSGQDTMYAIGIEGLVLDSGAGDDLFLFAYNTLAPNQHFNGNLGDDTLDFNAALEVDQPFMFDLFNGVVTWDRFSGGADPWVMTIEGVENVYGSFSDDIFIPGADSKVLNGDVGHDFFDITAGTFRAGQTFIGDVGHDTLSFADTGERFLVDLSVGVMYATDLDRESYLFTFEKIIAGSGNDTLRGSDIELVETLDGGAGDDLIEGRNGPNKMLGRLGDDVIVGGIDNDTVQGHNGADTLTGDAGSDKMSGGSGSDSILGEDGADTLKGDGGADIVDGGKGSDLIRGGNGKDSLDGGNAGDTIIGDTGADTMTGGGGGDLFKFRDGHGRDVITDFDGTEGDVIDLTGVSAIQTIADGLAALSTTVDGVLITTGTDSEILLIGLSLSDVDASYFLL